MGTAVLGAGPAGLSAAYVLALRGQPGVVFEADGVVGGLAKTVEFGGYRFDLGGHRFFTKLRPVERLWEEMLGDDFLTRPRLSRIYYHGKFFAYPLVAGDVLRRLGIAKLLRLELIFRPAEAENGLRGSGLIVVNPPWKLPDELKILLPALARALSADGGAATQEWLSGETSR